MFSFFPLALEGKPKKVILSPPAKWHLTKQFHSSFWSCEEFWNEKLIWNRWRRRKSTSGAVLWFFSTVYHRVEHRFGSKWALSGQFAGYSYRWLQMAEHIQLLRLQKNYIWTEYYRNFVNSLFLHFLIFNYKVRDEHHFSNFLSQFSSVLSLGQCSSLRQVHPCCASSSCSNAPSVQPSSRQGRVWTG